jgi:quercetin dioxygenase-like cupin family protein
VTPAFHEVIPNIPGKSLVAVIVGYPPGGKSPPHHHARSAFVTGYVLSGSIRSQVDGAQHSISENASTTEAATLLAVFVVNTGDTPLTTVDGR